jgi:hypothetical protein
MIEGGWQEDEARESGWCDAEFLSMVFFRWIGTGETV